MDVTCPYCGEDIPVIVDEGGGAAQRYVEDCPVCCRPIEWSIHGGEDGELEVEARRGDD